MENKTDRHKQPFLIKFPKLCSQCGKTQKPSVHSECPFCRDIGFREEILCDLNRSVQGVRRFVCHAFRPAVKRAISLVQRAGEISDNEDDSTVSREGETIFDSDRLKYDRALAVQRLLRNPDGVYGSLKYHLAWNVAMRRPVFEHPDDMFDEVNGGLSVCSKFAGGFVGLLWLAPDHIHIYVESDGEKSVDGIAKHIKRTSTEILHRMTDEVEGTSGIWDKAYFAETVG